MTSSFLARQLGAHPFMRGMEPHHVTTLGTLAELVEFPAGTRIFSAGGDADGFFLIRTGVVTLQLRPRRGSDHRTVQTLLEGTVLGWSWLFPPYRWEFDAVAETPVRAIRIDGGALREHCERDPALGFRLMQRIAGTMASRLHAARREVLDLAGP